MKPPPFAYQPAASLDEAVALLAEHGDEAKLIAGGQSLMPLLAFRLARPSILIDVSRAAELRYVEHVEGRLHLGAITRHREVEKAVDEAIPATVREALGHIGHVGIRNQGTVGGSLAHADPSAEWAALALAYDGVLVVASSSGERRIAAEDFFLDFLTSALEPDEVVRELVLELPPASSVSGFAEFARRHGDFAVGGVCAVVVPASDGVVHKARVSVLGAARVPTRCHAAEGALTGRLLDVEAIDDAVEEMARDIEPRGADEQERRYRLSVAKTLARRVLLAAADQLRPEHPERSGAAHG
jgi:carbon-monoxide dehydrogenase medium subunit